MRPLSDLAGYLFDKIVNGWRERSLILDALLIVCFLAIFSVCLAIFALNTRETILGFF
jgi:uncharacterized membrane protein